MPGVRLSRIELSAGGVIYRRGSGGSLEILLIRDSYGNWGFPKGHVEGDESPVAAALRECREETGLQRLRFVGRLGMTDWHFRSGGTLVHKFCDYVLIEADGGEQAQPQRGEGIQATAWLRPDAARERVTYANARMVLDRALEQLAPASAVEVARSLGEPSSPARFRARGK